MDAFVCNIAYTSLTIAVKIFQILAEKIYSVTK